MTSAPRAERLLSFIELATAAADPRSTVIGPRRRPVRGLVDVYLAEAAHPRLVAGAAAIRRDPAQGNRRRRAAAGRRRSGARCGRTRRGRRPTEHVGVRVRPGVAASEPELSAWAADGLLAIFFFVVGLELKREFVAGDLRDPGARRAADRGRRRRDGRPRRHLHRDQPGRGPPREPRRLGGADRHRHRVRARGAGGAVHASADGAAHVPADPCGRRRSARHHGDRRLLHRPPVAGSAGAGADPDRRCSGWRCSAACITGGCWSRWPRPRGRWCTPAGCTPPSRACCWASPCRCSAETGQPTAELFEHTMRPVSAGFAVPVFAFFAAGVTVGGWSGLGDVAAAADHRRRDRRPGDRQTPRRVGAPPSCWPSSPTPASTTTWRGATSSACLCWLGSGSQFRY